MLDPKEVHVWRVDLNDAAWDRLSHVLNDEEHAKARSFHTVTLQDHYRRCRCAVRATLARYTTKAADALIFQTNRFGKPSLADAREPWHFNVSHSGNLALIAVARHPVGIDIEWQERAGIDVDELTQSVCHPDETALLASLPADARSRLFFRIWTRKEAYVKALGLGLQHGLTAVRVSADTPVSRVHDASAAETQTFFLYDLDVPSGYVASACLALGGAAISCFSATPER